MLIGVEKEPCFAMILRRELVVQKFPMHKSVSPTATSIVHAVKDDTGLEALAACESGLISHLMLCCSHSLRRNLT